MNCFDHQIKRAIELGRMGYAVSQITQLIEPECQSHESAHLIARAAQVFLRGRSRRQRKHLAWIA